MCFGSGAPPAPLRRTTSETPPRPARPHSATGPRHSHSGTPPRPVRPCSASLSRRSDSETPPRPARPLSAGAARSRSSRCALSDADTSPGPPVRWHMVDRQPEAVQCTGFNYVKRTKRVWHPARRWHYSASVPSSPSMSVCGSPPPQREGEADRSEPRRRSRPRPAQGRGPPAPHGPVYYLGVRRDAAPPPFDEGDYSPRTHTKSHQEAAARCCAALAAVAPGWLLASYARQALSPVPWPHTLPARPHSAGVRRPSWAAGGGLGSPQTSCCGQPAWAARSAGGPAPPRPLTAPLRRDY
eukprot:TRINITY_DN11720_c0_g1_i1.p1 TRINITY_DN11720_c0_g1~~TRINITY_DN11720_c0_g1_i1.p1  ORF type:complete len:298 (+),score=5.74 TRINITY_DN11720_c0_g1_i1:79-972(+)